MEGFSVFCSIRRAGYGDGMYGQRREGPTNEKKAMVS